MADHKKLAAAFLDLECLVGEAKDRSNILWVLCNLTINNTGHPLTEEEEAALVKAINDVDQTSERLLVKWTDHHSYARHEDAQ